MESKKNVPNTYSLDFKLKVLSDMCENGLSTFGVAKKYGIKTHTTVLYWLRQYVLTEKSLSLSQETMQKVMEEKLQEEVSNLRKALQYSELRNEALQELLKIGKEEYGIDLLKKAGAKQ